MAQTITLTQSAYQKLLERVSQLEKAVASLMKRTDVEPPYGTDAWWEWSDKRAMEDIKAGRTKSFNSVKEMTDYLKTL